MKSLRTILYGYAVAKGIIIIESEEAQIVEEIFRRYSEGDILQKIADDLTSRKIRYYQEKTTWNKNQVSRIIDNPAYLGNDTYPAIINDSLFNMARSRKKEKGSVKVELPELTVHVRSLLICEQCGCGYRRINKWRSREKWFCQGGCKCGVYLDDRYILNSILSVINDTAANPKVLETDTSDSPIGITSEIKKQMNEIYRAIEQVENFETVSDMVFKVAEMKYAKIEKETNPAVTKELKQYLAGVGFESELQTETLKTAVQRIGIDTDGSLMLYFVNGSIIRNKMKGIE